MTDVEKDMMHRYARGEVGVKEYTKNNVRKWVEKWERKVKRERWKEKEKRERTQSVQLPIKLLMVPMNKMQVQVDLDICER